MEHSLLPQPSTLSKAVPTSPNKPWASFSHSLSIPQSLGTKGKPSLFCAGLPLDKPHLHGELTLATADTVHAISSVLPTDKRSLEQKLPLL